METLSNMALLARALDFTLTVRPPQGNREWITRLLDAGVWSLHAAALSPMEVELEADSSSFTGTEEDYMERFFVPGLQRAGGLRAVKRILGRAR